MVNHLMNVKSAIIVLMLISSAFFVATSAAEGVTLSSTNFRYEYVNGTEVKITDYIGQGGSVIVPGSLDGKPVTAIGDSAFSDNTKITSVTIPASVRLIDDYAFAYCTGLTSVAIGSNVTTIGNNSFFHCISLTSVSIPSSVRYIGSYAFADCTAMTSIGVNASNLDFSSVNGVLYNNAHTKVIQCPSGMAGTLTLPDGVTSIGQFAFHSCALLTSVIIPNSTISIDFEAFYYCTALTSVTIPENVTTLSFGVFYSCNSMTAINVSSSNPSFSSIDGVLYNKAATTLIQYPVGRAGPFTIPNGVTFIGSTSFYNCLNLTSVTLPSGVTRIDSYAFQNCHALTSVTIPSSLTVIAYQAFYACDALTSVTIPNGVTTIGGYVFAYCAALTSVTIPDSVRSIGDLAFGYCSSLTGINVGPGNAYYAGIDGVLYNKAATTLITYPAGKPGAFTVPDTVKMINDRAFSNCDNITTLAIGGNVTYIGNNSFYSCAALTSVTISNSVTNIGNSAFNYCSNLTSVILGSNVTTIGVQAFQSCDALTSVIIPGKVTSIGAQAFGNCLALTAINVPIGNLNYASVDAILYNKNVTTLIQCPGGKIGAVTIPGNVTNIGNSAFYGCSRLTSVTIPTGVTNIGNSAFYNCNSLTSVTIPGSVTTIENGALSGLTSLKQINVSLSNPKYTSVNGVLYDKNIRTLIAMPTGKVGSFVIPNSVTRIGASAFLLSNLTSIIIPGNITMIEERAFTDLNFLTHMQFDGNTPICGKGWLSSSNPSLKVYYVNGTSEFTSPTWFGVGTVAMFPVTGKVVDVNNKGLANLTVALENGASVMTDYNGSFSINAAPGGHSLRISGPGIDPKTVDVQVTGSGLAMGNIMIGNNGGELVLLILILIGAIVIILVLVFLLIRRRKGKTPVGPSVRMDQGPGPVDPQNQSPKDAAPSQPVPVEAMPNQSKALNKKCSNCGAETMDAPFCGICGQKME